MDKPRQPKHRYRRPALGEMCHVDQCPRVATHEVYLYDFGRGPEEFFEQDYTSPFVCAEHMEENERRAEGARVPRGLVLYPYTNRNGAQGFSRYQPMSEVFPELFVSAALGSGLLRVYQDINDELIRQLASTPALMYELRPRKFEELVAELFRDKGFSVTLTPATRDGGYDIHAVQSSQFGSSLYLIECKRYSPTRKVGVEVVRQLHGVVVAKAATRGIIATTSSFSRDAIQDALPLEYRMSLRDFNNIAVWLRDFGSGSKG